MSYSNRLLVFILFGILLAPPASAGCGSFFKKLFLGSKETSEPVDPKKVRTRLSEDMETIRKARELEPVPRKEAIHKYSAPKAKSWLDRSIVIADYAAVTYLGVKVVEGFQENPHALIPALLMVPPVLYAADFVGQIFHKWLDSYASEKNPIWGDGAREFRKHHEFPNNLNEVGYLNHVSAFGKILAPAFGATAAVANQMSPEMGAASALFLVSLLNTTEFHKQAHIKKPNLLFRVLQKARLALGHEEHMDHHRPPFDAEFAVMNGWSNGLARRTNLWNRLDKIFWKFTGKMPHNWIQDPRSIPEEVVKKLKEDLDAVPSELWDYAETFPSRVPSDLKEPIQKAKQKWQTDFIQKREAIYREMAETDREKAEKEWKEEQANFPWLYGNQVSSLF